MRFNSEKSSKKLRTALDLFDAGIEMMRSRLRREHPEASAEMIERFLHSWLVQRPGAEHGDAHGRPGAWPRKDRDR